MSNVLFVCVGNSGRSLTAERLFLRGAGDGQLPDPWGRSPDGVRAIRDDIAARVDALLGELD